MPNTAKNLELGHWFIRLSMTESELVLAEQKANDYGAVINRLKQDMAEMAVRHQTEIRKEKEVGF